MATATFTKSGTKATTPAKLDKAVFGLEVKNHELLKQAYLAHLANRRIASANTKKRGAVRGGGIKPWRQKGTGRARVGSIRSPIWRGGGIVFGPTGDQNYTHSLAPATKRQAVRQALSLANTANKLAVIEAFDSKEGKAAVTTKLLSKMDLSGTVLLVVDVKDDMAVRATRNIAGVKLVQANYLNVPDVLDSDHIVITVKALAMVGDWLAGKTPKAVEAKV